MPPVMIAGMLRHDLRSIPACAREPLVYPSPQPPSTPSRACISRQSTVSLYLRFTLTTWRANQHRFRSGIQSAASLALLT